MVYEILRTNFYIKWFDKQTREVRREVMDNLDNLQKGNFSNCEYVRDGISELKIHYGKGIIIYYVKRREYIFILLYGGSDKKRQQDDIVKAIKIKELIKGEI